MRGPRTESTSGTGPDPAVVGALLGTACPSTRSRLRIEILGQSRSDPEVAQLQEAILGDPLVREVLSWRHDDGWLGWDFHGPRGTETGVRILCEKGLDPAHPAVAGALDVLRARPERLERGLGKVGRAADDLGLGGCLLIRAVVFAYAGAEEHALVREQVASALEGFRAVLPVTSVADIAEPYRGRLVFLRGVRWPSIYHLRLLALTRGWRTPENRRLVTQAVRRLVNLSPLPEIHFRLGSQICAPASHAMLDFNPDLGVLDGSGWMMWFHRLELLARLGVVHLVPELGGQVRAGPGAGLAVAGPPHPGPHL